MKKRNRNFNLVNYNSYLKKFLLLQGNEVTKTTIIELRKSFRQIANFYANIIRDVFNNILKTNIYLL